MDGPHFDRITRALASEAPRRRALKLLASGASAGLLGLLSRSNALAAPKKLDVCYVRSTTCAMTSSTPSLAPAAAWWSSRN